MIASLSNDRVWSASICPSSDDGFLSYYQFPYKRPPFEGAGNTIPMKVSSGQGPPSCQKTFPEAGFVIPTKVLRPRPTFILKDHRFITFYKWPGLYPVEGFVAKAHLPYE